MNHPDYDQKVGWTKLQSMIWGKFPMYSDFSERFEVTCANTNQLFGFRNDPFAGNESLSCDLLWDLIQEVWAEAQASETFDEKRESWVSNIFRKFGYDWNLGFLILT
jgi:hypothetical protein